MKLPQVEDFPLWRQTRRASAVPERAELCFADVCAERLPLARSTVCQKTFMSDKEEEDEAKMEETHRKEKIYFVCQFDYNRENTGNIMINGIYFYYIGYRFGNIDVYCPWDVLNYCDTLRSNPDASPQNYWINTSNNDAVRVFIEQSDNGTTKREIERLVAGEKIKKEIRPELTYKDMYSSIDNLWSVLFTTGYLTQRGRQEGNEISLVIPNVEIRNIFTSQIMDFFKEQVKGDGHTLNRFCDALERGDAGKVEQCFNEYLKKTISIRDTFVKRPMKENFYHGILLGILGGKDKWGISSNRETGDGYSDIVVETENSAAGIILEIKYAHDGNLEESCKKALEQIVNTHYEEELKNEGIDRILKYGIACYKKRCKVQLLPSDPEK